MQYFQDWTDGFSHWWDSLGVGGRGDSESSAWRVWGMCLEREAPAGAHMGPRPLWLLDYKDQPRPAGLGRNHQGPADSTPTYFKL